MEKVLRTYAPPAAGRSQEFTIKRYGNHPKKSYYVTDQSGLHYNSLKKAALSLANEQDKNLLPDKTYPSYPMEKLKRMLQIELPSVVGREQEFIIKMNPSGTFVSKHNDGLRFRHFKYLISF